MISDSLEVEDIGRRVTPVKKIEKLDRVGILNVVLSFWGTTENPSKSFSLIEELQKFEKELDNKDNIIRVSKKLKVYFEELNILDDEDELGFHVCGYIGEEGHIHHVHHIRSLRKNIFINEDSKREFQGQPRYIEHPILFNGDNKIPNLLVNLIRYLNDSIIYEDFNREQAKEFLIFLMETAIKLQDFSKSSLTLGNLIDYPLRFCEIEKDSIRIEIINSY